jgi:hypothetical protein
MLSAKNIFQKNDFPKIILRRKLFYIETNRALIKNFYNEKKKKKKKKKKKQLFDNGSREF